MGLFLYRLKNKFPEDYGLICILQEIFTKKIIKDFNEKNNFIKLSGLDINSFFSIDISDKYIESTDEEEINKINNLINSTINSQFEILNSIFMSFIDEKLKKQVLKLQLEFILQIFKYYNISVNNFDNYHNLDENTKK